MLVPVHAILVIMLDCWPPGKACFDVECSCWAAELVPRIVERCMELVS